MIPSDFILTLALLLDSPINKCVRTENELRPQSYTACYIQSLSGPEEVVVSSDNRFEIHYTLSGEDAVDPADSDGNSIPDYVDYIIEALEKSYEVQIVNMGWRAPLPLQEGKRVSVYVEDVDISEFGYASPDGGCIGIRNNLTIYPYAYAYPSSVKGIVAHEFNHLSALAYTLNSNNYDWWWGEAVAMWAEHKTFPVLVEYPVILEWLLFGVFTTIYEMFVGYGNILWPLYLEEGNGDITIVRKIYEWLETHPGHGLLEATDEILKDYPDGNLKTAFKHYSEWNTFLGERNDGSHYSIADLVKTELGNIKFEAVYDKLPAEGKPEHPPEYFGINYIQLIPNSSMRGIKFRLEGYKGVGWGASMVGFKEDGADIVSKDGKDGKLEIAVSDVRKYDEVIIVVRNNGPDNYTGYYYYWLEHYEEEGCGCSAQRVNSGNLTGFLLIFSGFLLFRELCCSSSKRI